MKIGLIDVDGHNFPNLPLMKLSAYHKQQGDSVEWYEPLYSQNIDRVYMSKVFGFTKDYEYPINAKEIIKGGQGTVSQLKMAKKFLTNQKILNCLMRLNTSTQIMKSIMAKSIILKIRRTGF